MIITPQLGLGPLRLGMSAPEVEHAVGPPSGRQVLDGDRTILSFAHLSASVLVLGGTGIAGITIERRADAHERTSAELLGVDLFALDLAAVRAFCAENQMAVQEVFEPGDDAAEDVPAWMELTDLGLTLYLDDDGVTSVELARPSGTRGASTGA